MAILSIRNVHTHKRRWHIQGYRNQFSENVHLYLTSTKRDLFFNFRKKERHKKKHCVDICSGIVKRIKPNKVEKKTRTRKVVILYRKTHYEIHKFRCVVKPEKNVYI